MAFFKSKTPGRPFTVCIEGNTGSGKTTFLQNFKQLQNTLVQEEPVHLWQNVAGENLLELRYSDPERYGFLFQSYVQITRLQMHATPTHLPYKVMERSIFSTKCFIENKRRANMITDVEIAVLEGWNNWSMSNLSLEIDLIVYLRTTPEVVYNRIRQRARTEENSVTLEDLKSMHAIYEEWLRDRTLFSVPAPVVIIDADQSIEEMLQEFEKCKEKIYNKGI